MQDATRAQLCLTRLCEVTTPQLLLQLSPVVLRTSCCGAREPRSLAVAWWAKSLITTKPTAICVATRDGWTTQDTAGCGPRSGVVSRKRLQDRVHSAFQASRHEVEHRRRPADPGPPCDRSEQPLVHDPHQRCWKPRTKDIFKHHANGVGNPCKTAE